MQLTHKWLKSAGLKVDTEGLLVAAEYQSLATRSYQHRILNQDVNPMCRVCNHYEETIDHFQVAVLNSAHTDTIKLLLTSTRVSVSTTSKWRTSGMNIHQRKGDMYHPLRHASLY